MCRRNASAQRNAIIAEEVTVHNFEVFCMFVHRYVFVEGPVICCRSEHVDQKRVPDTESGFLYRASAIRSVTKVKTLETVLVLG